MNDLRKAAEMALDYIRREGWTNPKGKEVWVALCQALEKDATTPEVTGEVAGEVGEQPEQEPVFGACVTCGALQEDQIIKQPPKREWVGLTEEERFELSDRVGFGLMDDDFDLIEAKLKEKNT